MSRMTEEGVLLDGKPASCERVDSPARGTMVPGNMLMGSYLLGKGTVLYTLSFWEDWEILCMLICILRPSQPKDRINHPGMAEKGIIGIKSSFLNKDTIQVINITYIGAITL